MVMKEEQPRPVRLEDYKVPPYLVDNTRLHVDIQEDATRVKAILDIRRNRCADREDTGNLVLDGGKDLQTISVAVDGRELASNEFRMEDGSLTIFDAPEAFELTTLVEIRPEDNTALQGLYRSGDMLCTQCEAEGFRNITWYPDRPDVMSRYTTTIVADKARYPVLLSNGNAIRRGEAGDRHWVTWQDPFRKPAYLFALVAGDLEHIEDQFVTRSGRQVTLRIFTQARNLDKVDYALLSLKNAMRWDEEVYGREYDLDIFMIVAVESFNFGAMENKGLNIFNTACILAHPDTTTDAGYQRVEAVVAHEYFHNWSGNRVTCRDWFQLSLKEGFTVLRDQQFSAAMRSPGVCRVNQVATLRSTQFPEDAGPMAHSVRPDSYIEINNFYTATVYEKGAEVVRMIRTLLGEEGFTKGTDLYFERHDGEAVTTEEFVKAMEDANGVDLAQFRAWYRQAGTPVIKVRSSYDEENETFTLEVEQSCPPTPGQDRKEPFQFPLTVGLLDRRGEDIRFATEKADICDIQASANGYSAVLEVTGARQSFRFTGVGSRPVPSLLRGFSAPVKLNHDYDRDDLTFLMSHDSDDFNRWEAAQRLGVDVILEVVGQIEAKESPVVDQRLVRAFEANLTMTLEGKGGVSPDKAMIAQMLVLPAESYLAELFELVDVDAVHRARETVRTRIARALSDVFLSVYRLNRIDEEYAPSAEQVARRALKNLALSYLMQPDDTGMTELCIEQFESATNMTDSLAAISILVDSAAEAAQEPKERALRKFYNRWAHEPLVVDQWFAIQASSHLPGTLNRVKALMGHPAFDIKVPNRMRSLVASFAFRNPVNFHDRCGDGYAFLADRVIELDTINPQMAARVVPPLTRWRKYDAARQALMRDQLSRILATGNLSKDVYEIAFKSL